jgi:hypothetical protein
MANGHDLNEANLHTTSLVRGVVGRLVQAALCTSVLRRGLPHAQCTPQTACTRGREHSQGTLNVALVDGILRVVAVRLRVPMAWGVPLCGTDHYYPPAFTLYLCSFVVAS